jgi:hypothetical protein
MTWEEWLNSEYNTENYTVDSNGIGGGTTSSYRIGRTDQSGVVQTTDIISSEDYTWKFVDSSD